eukprot:COSAG06_NODE_11023_length_1580_cov_1.494261_1_plen_119_part_00
MLSEGLTADAMLDSIMMDRAVGATTTALDNATPVKYGELWLNSAAGSQQLDSVLIFNAENATKKCCGLTQSIGRQHKLIPLEQITGTHVSYLRTKKPVLLINCSRAARRGEPLLSPIH